MYVIRTSPLTALCHTGIKYGKVRKMQAQVHIPPHCSNQRSCGCKGSVAQPFKNMRAELAGYLNGQGAK